MTVNAGTFTTTRPDRNNGTGVQMTYFKCKWNHSAPDDPILLYSELDEERRETRKVEIFRNGKMGFADSRAEFGGSALGRFHHFAPFVRQNQGR